MDIKEISEEYLSELKNLKRYSKNTITAYSNDLTKFIDFCKLEKINELNKISQSAIRSYLSFLNEKSLDKRSVSRNLSALRGLLHFSYIMGYSDKNSSISTPNPKIKKKLPEITTLDSIIKIYDIADEAGKNTLLIKAIFELLYGCALRVSEICSLNKLDIDLKKCILRVTGKGNKVRIVPVGSKSVPVIKEYLESRTDNNKSLLVNDKGERIYPKLVYRIVNKYLSQVTDIGKKSPHIFRHSAATHMLDSGADLNTVKEILGHENLSTTQIYTHVSVERLKKTYKKAHPKS